MGCGSSKEAAAAENPSSNKLPKKSEKSETAKNTDLQPSQAATAACTDAEKPQENTGVNEGVKSGVSQSSAHRAKDNDEVSGSDAITDDPPESSRMSSAHVTTDKPLESAATPAVEDVPEESTPKEQGGMTGAAVIVAAPQNEAPEAAEVSHEPVQVAPREATEEPQHLEQPTKDEGSPPAVVPAQTEQTKELVLVQDRFDAALRSACLMIKPESILPHASEKVFSLRLQRALPYNLPLTDLLMKLTNVKEVDISGNQIGPVAFRCLMFAMAYNTTITTLNVANNHTDTDTAESVGKMLKENGTLLSLDLSGNYLGKDFLSRSIGPSLATNKSLQYLNCESTGGTDLKVLMEGASTSCTLVQLSISHNTLTNTAPFLQHLTTWLEQPECSLAVLEMSLCGLKGNDLKTLMTSLKKNQSVTTLDVTGNEVASPGLMIEFLLGCLSCSKLTTLKMSKVKLPATEEAEISAGDEQLSCSSSIQTLHMSACCLSNNFITSMLAQMPADGLKALMDLNLSDNPDLTTDALKALLSRSKGDDQASSLQRLSYGLNKAEDLPSILLDVHLTNLSYINLRRAKMTPAAVGQLGRFVAESSLETIVLDGIKVANTDAIKNLLAATAACKLVALSLDNCTLTDDDLKAVAHALGAGLPLTMLKLSSNRFGDAGACSLVDALLSQPTHPLRLMDLSQNRIEDRGAQALADLFKDGSSHKSQVQTINVSRNNITGEGLTKLVSVIAGNKLTTLVASDQTAQYEEEDMDAVLTELSQAIGLQPAAEVGCSSLPGLETKYTILLDGLGGNPGALGRFLDSASIVTDYSQQTWTYLSLSNILELCAVLKGQGDKPCMLTKEEWESIVATRKGAPAWLHLPDHRKRAMHFEHLTSNANGNKVAGLLDDEADAYPEEVLLMKDQLTGKFNGRGWILMDNTECVEKAMDFVNTGEAKVFNKPFMLSHLNVEVDDETSQQMQQAAKAEMSRRAAERAQDEAAHRQLIAQSYEESQARHAYRLANPAYANGRIW